VSAPAIATPSPGVTGTELIVTEIHNDIEAYVSKAVELTTDGMSLQRSPALTKIGRFLWVEFVLPNYGQMRVLAEIAGRSAETNRVVFRHCWPQDRAAYLKYVAQELVAVSNGAA